MRMVFDPTGPDGEVIDTPTDHRMLWWVHDKLALAAKSAYVDEAYAELTVYLRVNCQHHWRDYEAEEGHCAAHRQCLWCNDVEWAEVTE